MINRPDYLQKIQQAYRINPVVALLGPRQCGKTTLAKRFSEQYQSTVNYFDLEDPNVLASFHLPMLVLQKLQGLIVIDEVQRLPELFPIIRVLVDQDRDNRQFLILGSASRDLIQQSSETLAGRISHIELAPFGFTEVDDMQQLWLRGGFPRAYLANNDQDSMQWRLDYITTFLERDIPNLGFRIAPQTLRRFWMMLTHSHGTIFNASELGNSLGISHTSIRQYGDILSGTFMMRQLYPWYENIQKRQIKSPKIYFRDSGIFHALLGIQDRQALLMHPKLGASWEGFAIESIIRHHQATLEECYFWGVHSQAELDLLIIKAGKRYGFEIKFTDSPKMTKSLQISIDTLKLDHTYLIYPGNIAFPLTEDVQAVPLQEYLQTPKG